MLRVLLFVGLFAALPAFADFKDLSEANTTLGADLSPDQCAANVAAAVLKNTEFADLVLSPLTFAPGGVLTRDGYSFTAKDTDGNTFDGWAEVIFFRQEDARTGAKTLRCGLKPYLLINSFELRNRNGSLIFTMSDAPKELGMMFSVTDPSALR